LRFVGSVAGAYGSICDKWSITHNSLMPDSSATRATEATWAGSCTAHQATRSSRR
jgi:hypothetical protein